MKDERLKKQGERNSKPHCKRSETSDAVWTAEMVFDRNIGGGGIYLQYIVHRLIGGSTSVLE